MQLDSQQQAEDSNITYDYFVCVKKNDLIYDIDGKDEIELNYQVQDQYCSDHDSEDSNRESADANDYPDEDIDCERDSSDSNRSFDSDKDRRRRRRRNGSSDSDGDIDEEEAARRYNKKHNRED